MLAAILAAALTRAEIIERMKAPVLTKVSGLVQVVANCPAGMRREFQSPVSELAAETCRRLYVADRRQPAVFNDPAIVVTIGDVQTNDTRVIVKTGVRDTGAPLTRILLPAPAFADVELFRLEVVRAYWRAVKGEEIDLDEARRAMRAADSVSEPDPDRRADWAYEQIARWENGERVDADDEEMIRLSNVVLVLGSARVSDVLRFASRLRLYPETFDRPFCGKYRCCTFKEAVGMRNRDPRIRLLAYMKVPALARSAAGRSEELVVASDAYAKFLLELARNKLSDAELLDLLDEADVKLEIALEQARKREEERKKE